MKKGDRKILEKIFLAEIEDRLPCQLRSKHLPRLQEQGLIEPMVKTLGGRFPMTIPGWQLTHRGRIEYCEWCERRAG